MLTINKKCPVLLQHFTRRAKKLNSTRQVLSFYSVRGTGSKFTDFEDTEEKQTTDQSTAVNRMHFLSHTGPEKIINNWFRTNIPLMHQISSSFISLGSKKKSNHQIDKLQQMSLQDISDTTVC